MYPLDRTTEYEAAFDKAEKAWLRWKRSPLGHPAYEQHGEVLMQAFIEAARTYLNYARHHTRVRRQDPVLYEASRDPDSRTEDDALDIPDFLRRDANT